MPNTAPSPPFEQRSTPELLEALCLELRYVGVGDDTLPDDLHTVDHIRDVQRIHEELAIRHVDVHERIEQLSAETNWQMQDLLQDCLAFPKVVPYVKESDGIRRALRCIRCRQREMPDRKGIWLCDVCLADALSCIETRTPKGGFVLFRTYNPSKWCEHSDAETVLLSLDGSGWLDDGHCRICLSQEQQRRTRTTTGASLSAGEAIGQAWKMLSDAEDDSVWERFYADFNFRPSVHPQDWPSIQEPIPSATYSISSFYSAASNPRVLEKDLDIKMLEAFQRCVAQEGCLYALDWQHICYRLYPHRFIDSQRPQAWKVPVLPNGDYYIFLAEDFSLGLFGHPWEQTICLFGQRLLVALALDMPLLFAEPIRRDGKAVF